LKVDARCCGHATFDATMVSKLGTPCNVHP